MNEIKKTYIENLYATETPKLRHIRKKIAVDDFPIHITRTEGRLLQVLIKAAQVKKIVEIGTLAGYSTLWMANALPHDGHIYTLEHDAIRFARAQHNLNNKKNITLVKGDAKETLQNLARTHDHFDMIFIDADKKSYLYYLDWAEQHIRQGGLIIADDTLLKGAVYMDALPYRIRQSTKDTLIEFNRRLADPEKFESILLPTDAGLTIAVKK